MCDIEVGEDTPRTVEPSQPTLNLDGEQSFCELIKEFKSCGEMMGYAGKALTTYIHDELTAFKRQKHEFRMKQLELEHQRDAESGRLALERTRLVVHENVKRDRIRNKETDVLAGTRPKIPYWDDNADDMESYLRRFESYAAMNKWAADDLPCYLSAHLKGRALTYFQEMQEADARSFPKVKKHLLTRFQCTQEGFRRQFRSARPEREETMAVFFSRIRRYFSRWLELAEINKDFNRLVDLLLREQLLASLSSNVVAFLMERKDQTVDDMVEAADRYREAHSDRLMAAHTDLGLFCANVGISEPHSTSSRGLRRPPTKTTDRYYHPGDRHASGYTRFRNNMPTTRSWGNTRGDSDGVDPISLKFYGDRRRCWGCSAHDHAWKYCRRLQFKPSSTSQRPKFASIGIMVNVESDDTQGDCAKVADEVAIGMSVADNLPPSIQTCQGTIGGAPVTVMLDSGCSTVGVRRSLLRREHFLNKVQLCRLFNGQTVQLPVALVSLDCPYFSGTVEACVIDNPVCDVILGRVDGSTFHCAQVAGPLTHALRRPDKKSPFARS